MIKADDFVLVECDAKDLEQELRQFDSQMPNIARKLMRAVNNQVKKDIRKEARARGYRASHHEAWGDAGYSKNLKSYADRDYKGKIMFTKNAFHYRFIEVGANVRPKNKPYLVFKINGQFYKSRGFSLPARPLLRPIAKKYWETSKGSVIMEEAFQKEMDKYFRGKK